MKTRWNAVAMAIPGILLAGRLLLGAVADGAERNTPPIPDTAEGRRIGALLQALANPEPVALKAFVETNFAASALAQVPVETRVQRLAGMAARMGKIDLVRIVSAADGRAEFVAKARESGDVLTIGLELEPGAEKKIRGLRVDAEPGGRPGASDEAREAPKASDAEVVSATSEWLAGLAAKDEFSGAVLITRGGRPLFARAYGFADRENKVRNTVDTRFNVGSIGKAFTSAAIARLFREGKLSESDTIGKVLPGSKIPSADRITVRQLLEMTSGLGDIFGPEFAANPHRLRELSDYLTLFETKPLEFEPGTKRAYSNAGYVVLGLMIEKVTGKKYRDYVRETVFVPAGMTDTAFLQVDEPAPRRAIGYTRREGNGLRPNIEFLPGRGSSAGGVFSTVGDLAKFADALSKGTVALASFTPDGPRGGLGIAGGTPGCNAVLESDPERGFTVVVLVNEDPPLAERTGRRIRQWLAR